MKLLDTSCLSLFLLEIPVYDFLNELFCINESLNITKQVENEFMFKDPSNKLDEYVNSGKILLNNNIEYDELKRRYPMLGKGELSIIQWGLNLKDTCSYHCVLDDLKARKIATSLGLSISGSVGLIVILKEKNKYSKYKIDEIIDSIENSNFRISDFVLNKLRE